MNKGSGLIGLLIGLVMISFIFYIIVNGQDGSIDTQVREGKTHVENTEDLKATLEQNSRDAAEY